MTSIDQEEVSQRIRFFRKERGMTQEELGLAIGAGTSQSAKAAIARVESGQVPGGLRLQRISQALRCSADILLSGTSRELFEVIRYTVRCPAELPGPALSAFRVGRIFLHFAVASGNDQPGSAFVETANRLFYLAQQAPKACRRLFSVFPRQNPRELVGNDDFRALIRAAMQDRGEDPVDYLRFDFALRAIATIEARYVPPQAPVGALLQPGAPGPSDPADAPDARATAGQGLRLPVIRYETDQAGDSAAPARERVDDVRGLPRGLCLVRVTGDSMEPLARNGQHVMVAAADREPRAGDLVVCWSRRKGTLFKRLLEKQADTYRFFDVSPVAADPLSLPVSDVLAMRVVLGVIFGR